MTALAASVVGAGVLAAAWNAGERTGSVTAAAAGVPAPSSTRSTTPTAPGSSPSSAPPTSPRGSASTAPAPATSGTAKPSTAPAAGAIRQVNGPTISTRYGPVQVQVDLSGSTITDIVALKLTNSSRTSQEISASAAPLLRQEALAAQSARIDGVSGATYTSQGYEQSLQAALDAAHA